MSSPAVTTEAYDALWKKIRSIKFAMLTSQDASGDLTSQPMTTVQETFDGALWFFVSRHAAVMRALDHDASVNLAYAEPKDDLYVSLSGVVSVDPDRQRREQLWNVMVKAWFPKGIDDPDLLLIRVDVHAAEYWDVKESRAVQLFKLARAVVKHERVEALGEHARVRL